MIKQGLLESLVEEDYGLEINGQTWARAKEHDSLVINREKQLFWWNSLNLYGDAFVYLTKVRNLSARDAKDYLKHAGFYGTFILEIKDGEETVVYPKLVDVFHEQIWEVDREYFHKRTITDDTIRRFQLGYWNEFYTIPFYVDGVFKQFQLRKDNPKTIRNYYRGVGPVIFNAEIMRLTNKIFITEGITSCIVLLQNGIPCISYNSGAEGFQATWLRYFTGQKSIYLLYDNDSAGTQGAKITAKILGEYRCKVYNFWGESKKGYDANDWFIDGRSSTELLTEVYSNSKYSFEL